MDSREAPVSTARRLVHEGHHPRPSHEGEALRVHLLSTGRSVLVEASPRDRVWGIGLGRDNPMVQQPARWRGRNLLGFALVHARDVLRGDRTPVAPGPWLSAS